MIVRGIRKENVEVDVEPKRLVFALAEVIGVKDLFEDNRDEYSLLKENDGKYYLVNYRNSSYHGTPHYNEYSNKELSKDEFDIAQALVKMLDILKLSEKC